ncbi:hypothetical protein ES703_106212 [subsurface metagenome]
MYHPTVEVEHTQDGQLVGGSEYTGVERYATHEVGVRIVHLATDQSLSALGIHFGGDNTLQPLSRRIISGAFHHEGIEYPGPGQVHQSLPCHQLGKSREQDQAHTAVLDLRTGLKFQVHCADGIEHLIRLYTHPPEFNILR